MTRTPLNFNKAPLTACFVLINVLLVRSNGGISMDVFYFNRAPSSIYLVCTPISLFISVF